MLERRGMIKTESNGGLKDSRILGGEIYKKFKEIRELNNGLLPVYRNNNLESPNTIENNVIPLDFVSRTRAGNWGQNEVKSKDMSNEGGINGEVESIGEKIEKHKKPISLITAAVLTGGIMAADIQSVSGNDTNVNSTKISGEVLNPIKYDDIFAKLESREKKITVPYSTLIFQLKNPYYAAFDSTGKYQIRKLSTAPNSVNGEIVGLTTPLAESLGYKTFQNDATKTIIYKNGKKQITYKNGSKIIQTIEQVEGKNKIKNITAKTPFIYNKNKNLCKGSESIFLAPVGVNNFYGANLNNEFVDYIKSIPQGGEGFELNDMVRVLKCLEPENVYGNNKTKAENALNKYQVVPIELSDSTIACVSEKLFNETLNILKKDSNRFKLVAGLDLLEPEMTKSLGLDKYKNDTSLAMVYKNNNQEIFFGKNPTGLIEGWQTINGKSVKVKINVKGQVEQVVAVEKSREEIVNLICTHMAEGGFAKQLMLENGINGNWFCLEPNSGAVIVFSENDLNQIDKNKSLLEQNITKSIKSNLNPDDLVFIYNGKKYYFNSKQTFIREGSMANFAIEEDINGNTTEVKFLNRFQYLCQVKFSRQYGIVATDGDRITDILESNGKFESCYPNYILMGTPEEKINRDLDCFMASGEIDKADVLKYRESGSDKECNSFKVLYYFDEKGVKRPGCVIEQEGKYGLKKEIVDNILWEVDYINNINPALLRQVIEVAGVRGISYQDFRGDIFKKYSDYGATFNWEKNKDSDWYCARILINQNRLIGKKTDWVRSKMGALLIMEGGGGLNGLFNSVVNPNETLVLPDRLGYCTVLHKALFLKNKAVENMAKLNYEHFSEWFLDGLDNAARYDSTINAHNEWQKYRKMYEDLHASDSK